MPNSHLFILLGFVIVADDVEWQYNALKTPNTFYETPNTCYETPNTFYETPNTFYETPNTFYETSTFSTIVLFVMQGMQTDIITRLLKKVAQKEC